MTQSSAHAQTPECPRPDDHEKEFFENLKKQAPERAQQTVPEICQSSEEQKKSFLQGFTEGFTAESYLPTYGIYFPARYKKQLEGSKIACSDLPQHQKGCCWSGHLQGQGEFKTELRKAENQPDACQASFARGQSAAQTELFQGEFCVSKPLLNLGCQPICFTMGWNEVLAPQFESEYDTSTAASAADRAHYKALFQRAYEPPEPAVSRGLSREAK
ncbi:MAG: hypothetical protein RJB38_962 [Pseudomonadota bacterium]|jgi:hypothetical protein